MNIFIHATITYKENLMKKRALTVFTALLCVLPLALAGCSDSDVTASEGAGGTQHKDTDSIVEVNGTVLTYGELQEQMQPQIEAIQKQVPEEKRDLVVKQMREKFIENFITRTLLLQEADKRSITVSAEEADSKIAEFRKQLPDGMDLESTLKMGGMTLEKMREEVLFGLRMEKLLAREVKQDHTATDEEIKAYYNDNNQKFNKPETVHARHILIKTDPKDDEKTKSEKRSKIDELKKQLDNGADFAQLAKENSDCPSRTKGGDLGTFSRGRMVKAFEDAAFGQSVDEIGPVIETRFGFHIIQVLAHNQPRQQSLDEVKNKIAGTLERKKNSEAVQKYIDSLRSKAKITYAERS